MSPQAVHDDQRAETRRRRFGVIAAVLGGAILLTLAPLAQAAVKAKASLVTASGAARIEVTLTGLTAASRPTGVQVTAGGKVFRLKKVTAAKWRTAPLSSADQARANRSAGKAVAVRLRTASGTTTLRPKLAAPKAGAPASPQAPAPNPPPVTPGAQPLFPPPAQKLTGTAAAEHLRGFFLNSRFTDCPAGWPACAVEEKYDHCPDGSWSYFRITPSSGSDINSVGSFEVTGAEANTDGSWGVEYLSRLGSSTSISFYSWRVSPTGGVTGLYWPPGTHPSKGDPPSQQLGPFTWQRPTNCGQKL